VGIAINRLHIENDDLQRKVLEAVACGRFYASGATDEGARATIQEFERAAGHATGGIVEAEDDQYATALAPLATVSAAYFALCRANSSRALILAEF
jgi:hypothetical protein